MAGIKLWVKFLLFISSFSPLALIWGWRFKDILLKIFNYEISVFYLILCISLISIVVLIISIESSRRNNNPQIIKIKSVEDLNKVHIDYLLTYIFAFLPENNLSIFSFLIFIFVLLIVYMKSNLIYVNPILSLLFYDVVKLNGCDNENMILITRRKNRLIKNERVRCSILSGEVFVETK